MALGATEYLTKPVAKDTFLNALRTHLKHGVHGNGSERVLVVDDEDETRQLMKEVLDSAGYVARAGGQRLGSAGDSRSKSRSAPPSSTSPCRA